MILTSAPSSIQETSLYANTNLSRPAIKDSEKNILTISDNTNYDGDIEVEDTENTEVGETEETENRTAKADELREKLKAVEDKQGFLGKFWNGLKKITKLGISSNTIEEKIKDYENGKISYEEVEEAIESYEGRQESGSNIVSNVITVGATALGVIFAPFTGGASLAIGAGIGALTKMGTKFADRATNNVKGDALDAKQMIKDAASGAVTGIGTAATLGAGSLAGAGAKAVAKEAGKSTIKEVAKSTGKSSVKELARQVGKEAGRKLVKQTKKAGKLVTKGAVVLTKRKVA